MPRRHYSDVDRATALAVLKASGGNLNRAARETGIPRKTLDRWRTDPALAAPADLRLHKEQEAAGAWSSVRDLAVERARALLLDPTTKLQLRDLSWTAAVATDKVQLLTGKPTERTEVTNLADFLRTQSGTVQPPAVPAERHVSVPPTSTFKN